MMAKFWFSLIALGLMMAYTAGVDALAAQVPGFTLPPIWVFFLITMNPVILLAAHALPSVFNMLPGIEGTITIPVPDSPKVLLVPQNVKPDSG